MALVHPTVRYDPGLPLRSTRAAQRFLKQSPGLLREGDDSAPLGESSMPNIGGVSQVCAALPLRYVR